MNRRPTAPELPATVLGAAAGACFAGFTILTVLVAGRHGTLGIDRATWSWLVDHRGGVSTSVARLLSHLGDPVTLVALAMLAAVWLARRRSPVVGLAAVASLAAASLSETTMKLLVGRSRPPVYARLIVENDHSFPSGHAAGSAALFVVVALLATHMWSGRARQVGAVLAGGALAGLVGLSRLILGVHWLTDVVAGWLLGVGWAVLAVLILGLVEDRFARRSAHRSGHRAGEARTSSAAAC